MAHSSLTPRGRVITRGRMYSAAVKNPAGHKTNAEMEAEMVQTEIDPAADAADLYC